MVLRIRFNTTDLTWAVSADKRDNILRDVAGPLWGNQLTLEQLQHLMGVINDFGQMCPFLSGFRQPLNCALSAALEHPSRLQQLPFQARQDLRVWAAVVTYSVTPLPIPHRPVAPSLSALHFVSDAEGARYVTERRKRIPTETPGDRGGGGDWYLPVWCYLAMCKDDMAHVHAAACFGRKGAGLRLQVYHVGNYRPFTTHPDSATSTTRQRTVSACRQYSSFLWLGEPGGGQGQTASVFVRALHLISTYLGCRVHVLHLPRMSTPDARLADRLSRKHTTTTWDRRRIRGAIKPEIPPSLWRWMVRPCVNWSLPQELLLDVQDTMRRHL
jgi:hypothetical protein